MAEKQVGRIIRSLSGFYDVRLPDGVVTCRGRGILRKEQITPLTGDLVEVSVSGGKGMVEAVLPRINSFIRPAVANVDALVLFAANVNPVTEPFLIDRVTAIAGNQNVPCVICVNKSDLDPAEQLAATYEKAGFPVIRTSAKTGQGIRELRDILRGKLTAFTGNSGVGKSSILNKLLPGAAIPTGEVSEKLGRGKHTTRHVELYSLGGGTYVADTPGFASFDVEMMNPIPKEQLQYDFIDFEPYLGRCRFNDCAHLKEPGCAVTQALDQGKLMPSRYRSYVRLYELSAQHKSWEIKA